MTSQTKHHQMTYERKTPEDDIYLEVSEHGKRKTATCYDKLGMAPTGLSSS